MNIILFFSLKKSVGLSALKKSGGWWSPLHGGTHVKHAPMQEVGDGGGGGGAASVKPDAEIQLIEKNLILHAAPWRHLDFSRNNWDKEFSDGLIHSPIEIVKLGENQFEKLKEKQRTHYFGLIKPTIESPVCIISEMETPDELLKLKEKGQRIQRPSKLKFIKTFIKPDGKYQGFCCVTVAQGDLEVSISSSPRRIRELANFIKNSAAILYGGSLIKEKPKALGAEDSLQIGFLNETIPNEDEMNKSVSILFFRLKKLV